MNWTALTKKQQQLVIVTIILAILQIVLMVHFLGWTKPASARGGVAKKELLDFEQKINAARAILKCEDSILSELTQSVEKLEALTVHLPSLSDRYAWSYEYVSRCATLSNVELDNLEEVFFMTDSKKPAVTHPYEKLFQQTLLIF